MAPIATNTQEAIHEPTMSLEQAVAQESAARRGLDEQRAAHLAALKVAEGAKKVAEDAVKTAAAEVAAREAQWKQARETAWKAAHTELGPGASDKGHGHGDGLGGGHGHDDHEDTLHGAKHQLQHRWVEKTGFGAAERVVMHVSETLGERAAERIGEQALERGVERLAERAVERGAEVAFEKAGLSAGQHMLARVGGEAIRMGEETAIHAFKALRVIVPLLGIYFVHHLAKHDWDRFKESKGFPKLLFLIAVIGDWVDILVHVIVVYAGIGYVEHHFLHEVEAYGMKAAICACLACMFGEIADARKQKAIAAAKKAADPKIVAVHP